VNKVRFIIRGGALIIDFSLLQIVHHSPEVGASTDVLRAYKESGKSVFVPPRLVSPAPSGTETRSHSDILLEDGPDAYAKHILSQKQVFVMDTTWRDAHHSLLVTRMRTSELVKSADYVESIDFTNYLQCS
jgi:pyruvate carboxylase